MHRVNKFYAWFKKYQKRVRQSIDAGILTLFCTSFLAEVTNSDVNTNDFEEVVDAKTGKKVLRMKKEVAKRKGFVGIDEIDFEVVIDQTTGQQTVQIKSHTGKAGAGNRTFEMFTDPKTGQQTLRMKEEVDLACKQSNGAVPSLLSLFPFQLKRWKTIWNWTISKKSSIKPRAKRN